MEHSEIENMISFEISAYILNSLIPHIKDIIIVEDSCWAEFFVLCLHFLAAGWLDVVQETSIIGL